MPVIWMGLFIENNNVVCCGDIAFRNFVWLAYSICDDDTDDDDDDDEVEGISYVGSTEMITESWKRPFDVWLSIKNMNNTDK